MVKSENLVSELLWSLVMGTTDTEERGSLGPTAAVCLERY